MASPPWENFTAFFVQKQVLCADISSKKCKKKCVRVAFHSKFAKPNISRVWKLQNFGPVYECLTLTRTNENTGIIWNTLICIRNARYDQNRKCITAENGVCTNTAICKHGNNALLYFREKFQKATGILVCISRFPTQNPKCLLFLEQIRNKL